MLAQQLQAAKLKKTAQTTSKSPLPVICGDDADYQRLMQETYRPRLGPTPRYFEEYWPKIQAFTFPSTFVALSVDAAEALLAAHRRWKAASGGLPKGQWKEEFPALVELASLIDSAKERLNVDHIFVRLSSRSPKDAALSRKGFEELLETELVRVKEAETDHRTSSLNQRLHALYRASTVALMVSTGEEGVQLLVESPRIQGDLEMVVREHKQDFNIVVRAWGDFDVELEFRAFIYKRNLTAVTQYNEFIFFPTMLQNKKAIVERLKRFVEEELLPVIELPSMVIDFALAYPRHDGDDFRVYVVELNPFAEFAGTGLFDWTGDFATLTGKQPFEFRAHTKEPEGVLHRIGSNWILPNFVREESVDRT